MDPLQRWDGHTREATDWNELRRDPELCFPDGNTLVYLYSRGRSQRGPSFRIPYDFLLYSGCRPLVERSLISTLPTSPYCDQETKFDSGESYLYLHAPEHLSREESFAYHVTTRNFFAWLIGAPIVGSEPVSALLALKDRMDIWRDEGSDNFKAICNYIREQGYGDISQIEDQLSHPPKPTLYRDQYARYEGVPTLKTPNRRSGSVAVARQSLRKRIKISESLQHRQHFADLFHPLKKDGAVLGSAPLREGHLATIAYEDTSPDVAPSLTAQNPKPKLTKSIGRNCNYTEIVVPDYGNGLRNNSRNNSVPTRGLANPNLNVDPVSNSKSDPFLPRTSPTEAYTRRRSQITTTKSSSSSSLTDHPTSSSSSSSSSSLRSDVPSLLSTYSTEEGEGDTETDTPTTLTAPDLLSSTLPPSYTFHDHITPSTKNNANKLAIQANRNNSRLKIAGTDTMLHVAEGEDLMTQPGLSIDALIGELEAAGLEDRRPKGRYRSA